MERIIKSDGGIKAKTITGILLVAIGCLVLLNNFNIIHFSWEDIFNWQIILIIVGLFLLCDKDSRTVGYILISIGSFFLLCHYVDISYSIRKLFWPGVLIVLGLSLIIGKRTRKANSNDNFNSNDYIDDYTFFGRNSQKSTSQKLTGGKITTIFGGSTINLLDTKLAAGQNELKLRCICGGSKLIVPNSWNIKIEGTSIFGGTSDRRNSTPAISDELPMLTITGTIFMGSCKIISNQNQE